MGSGAAPREAARNEEALTCVVIGALEDLKANGVDDPLVAFAAGDLCAEALVAFVARCRDVSARLRISDSLALEMSRLLGPAAEDRSTGLRALVVATRGQVAWRQATECALTAIVASETRGAVVCGIHDEAAWALTLFRSSDRVAVEAARPTTPFEATVHATFSEWEPRAELAAIRRGRVVICRMPPPASRTGGGA